MNYNSIKTELSDDLISRNAVLKQTYLWSKDEFLRVTNPFDYLRKRINDIPPVNPQEPKWISVSERLPEDSGEYLVSVIDEYDENYEVVGVAWFAHKKDYDIKESEWQELGIDETVIAWMSLPKPYEPQESEESDADCD